MQKQEVIDEFKKLYIAKNKDYGNSADSTYETFGDIAYLVRLSDKYSRWDTLAKQEREVKSESVLDTVGDFFCYSCMWRVSRDKKKKLDVPSVMDWANLVYTSGTKTDDVRQALGIILRTLGDEGEVNDEQINQLISWSFCAYMQMKEGAEHE